MVGNNDAHHWQWASDLRYETTIQSRRPMHAPLSHLSSRLLNIAPLRLLDDDAVAIWVFVRTATRLPVRIEGRDLFEASVQQPRACRLPLRWSCDVENQ